MCVLETVNEPPVISYNVSARSGPVTLVVEGNVSTHNRHVLKARIRTNSELSGSFLPRI